MITTAGVRQDLQVPPQPGRGARGLVGSLLAVAAHGVTGPGTCCCAAGHWSRLLRVGEDEPALLPGAGAAAGCRLVLVLLPSLASKSAKSCSPGGLPRGRFL